MSVRGVKTLRKEIARRMLVKDEPALGQMWRRDAVAVAVQMIDEYREQLADIVRDCYAKLAPGISEGQSAALVVLRLAECRVRRGPYSIPVPAERVATEYVRGRRVA